MSKVEQEGKLSFIRGLQDELAELRKQQLAAQEAGAARGMTVAESENYKERHNRILNVLKQLGAFQRRT